MHKSSPEIPTLNLRNHFETVVADWHKRNNVIGRLATCYVPVEGLFIDLILGNGNNNHVNGWVNEEPDGHLEAHIQFLEVRNPSLRRHGIGSRLMKAFVAQVIDLGATQLQSTSVSLDALRLRAKIFGEDSLDFYDSQSGPLPITYQQALEITRDIDERHAQEIDYELFGDHLGVSVDLTELDASDWERPLIVNQRD